MARMMTYKVSTGDVVKFPNGMEVNYDEVTESLVVLHADPSRMLTIRPEMTRNEIDDHILLSAGTWLIGSIT